MAPAQGVPNRVTSAFATNTAQAFLAPYHLNIFEGSTVSADHTKGDIANKRAGKAAENVLLACTDKSR
jgi:hypothetical protein